MRVHAESLVLIRHLCKLLDIVRKDDPDLARQIRRAVSSIVLNVAEGCGRDGKDGVRCFRIARGSALEVQAGLQLARGLGCRRASQLAPALEAAGNVRRMLHGLVR